MQISDEMYNIVSLFKDKVVAASAWYIMFSSFGKIEVSSKVKKRAPSRAVCE